MEKGSLNELMLTRSAIKHIRKHDKAVVRGAAVGDDFSQIGGLAAAEGVYHTPFIAWTKAMNNLAVSGARPLGVRIEALLPEQSKEADVKAYMSVFNGLADESGITILGGHTEVQAYYKRASFIVVALGNTEEAGCGGEHDKNVRLGDIKSIAPGMDIIMTKQTGLLGTDLLAEMHRERLEERFAKSYIDGALFGREAYSIKKEADVLYKSGMVCYMHDVSHGGVYAALRQLGVRIKRGITVSHEKLSIRQETVELCEFFNINPYMLEGTGSLLAVAPDGEAAVDELIGNGVEAAVVGKVSEDNDKVVLIGSDPQEKRFLNLTAGDEIYKTENV